MSSGDLVQLLKAVELFDGLTTEQVELLASICEEQTYKNNEVIFSQGEEGNQIYVVRSGFVEVLVGDQVSQSKPRAIVNLGAGQLFGEMALVDRGARSATVRSITPETIITVLRRSEFTRICDEDNSIGYAVMRNMAADLSFKLRHRNLASGLD